ALQVAQELAVRETTGKLASRLAGGARLSRAKLHVHEAGPRMFREGVLGVACQTGAQGALRVRQTSLIDQELGQGEGGQGAAGIRRTPREQLLQRGDRRVGLSVETLAIRLGQERAHLVRRASLRRRSLRVGACDRVGRLAPWLAG